MFCISKNIPIFAPELTPQTSFKALYEAAFFMPANQSHKGCCIPSGSRSRALLTSASVREQRPFFIINNIIFKPTMHTSIKNSGSAKHSTAAATSAHETCATFLYSTKVFFPELRNIRYRRIAYDRPRYIFRARYAGRRLYAVAYDHVRVIERFKAEIRLKAPDLYTRIIH